MTHAYPEYYLEDAMNNLGAMLDCAVNVYGYSTADFYQMFLTSGLDKQFGNGNPRYICGMSGVELAEQVIHRMKGNFEYREYSLSERTPEFWAGWVLAYFQWYSGYSFRFIQQNGLPIEKIVSLYPTLHEADLSHFVTVAHSMISTHRANEMQILKRLRRCSQLTQEELAKMSGVSLRMIQAYEQNRQELSKAEAGAVLRLARVLHCTPEELCV